MNGSNCTQDFYFYHKLDMESNRKIGKITVQERFLKIQKFKQKKQCRVWQKKISYNCRKEVADKRLRIKGRFIRKSD